MNVMDLYALALACVDMPKGLGHPVLSQVSETETPYYRFLYKVMELYNIGAALECGVYMGTGTAHMAAGNPNALVFGVDMVTTPSILSLMNTFHNIIYIEGSTIDPKTFEHVRKDLEIANRRLGLVMLDSEHNGEIPRAELSLYRPLMDDECLLVCDDIVGLQLEEWKRKAMQKFWGDVPGEKVELDFLHPPHVYDLPGFGVSILRKGDV